MIFDSQFNDTGQGPF